MIIDHNMNLAHLAAQQGPQELNVLNIPDGDGLTEGHLRMNLETLPDPVNLENMEALDDEGRDLILETPRALALENMGNNTDTESEASDIFDLFPLHDSSVPLTLSLSSHFLLTNGPEPSCLALWDTQKGKFMGFLDDSNTSTLNRSRLGPLRFAEISVDSSMIYSVSGDLIVWNFMDLKNSESEGIHRYFVKGRLHRGDDVWIGYETHEKI